MLAEQFPASLVLHEEVREAVEHLCIASAIPLEEDLLRAEDARDAVGRDIAVFQDMKVVVPELVFYEQGADGMNCPEKAPCVARCVKRQIAYDVRTLVVLAHFVA